MMEEPYIIETGFMEFEFAERCVIEVWFAEEESFLFGGDNLTFSHHDGSKQNLAIESEGDIFESHSEAIINGNYKVANLPNLKKWEVITIKEAIKRGYKINIDV
jgi:hypothetical protein